MNLYAISDFIQHLTTTTSRCNKSLTFKFTFRQGGIAKLEVLLCRQRGRRGVNTISRLDDGGGQRDNVVVSGLLTVLGTEAGHLSIVAVGMADCRKECLAPASSRIAAGEGALADRGEAAILLRGANGGLEVGDIGAADMIGKSDEEEREGERVGGHGHGHG